MIYELSELNGFSVNFHVRLLHVGLLHISLIGWLTESILGTYLAIALENSSGDLIVKPYLISQKTLFLTVTPSLSD